MTTETPRREPVDRYYTPRWTVDQCIREVLPELRDDWDELSRHTKLRVLEPCAGKGVFVEALAKRFPGAHITANDLDPQEGPWPGAAESSNADFLLRSYLPHFHLCVTNPPFTLAREFAEQAWLQANWTVLLVRQGWMASAERAVWWRQHPPALVANIPNRPVFYGGGDKADYCWVCWGPGRASRQTRLIWLEPLDLAVRKGA